jgi:hypothetical protein
MTITASIVTSPQRERERGNGMVVGGDVYEYRYLEPPGAPQGRSFNTEGVLAKVSEDLSRNSTCPSTKNTEGGYS